MMRMGVDPQTTNLNQKRFFFGLSKEGETNGNGKSFKELNEQYPLKDPGSESISDRISIKQFVQRVNHSSYRKRNGDKEYHQWYYQQLHQKWENFYRRLRNKHNQYMQNHVNIEEYSSRYRAHQSSILDQIYGNISWHRKTSNDVKKDVLNILKGVLNRADPVIVVKLAQIFEGYQHRIATNKFDIGEVPGIEYKVKLKDGVKPKRFKPSRLPPEHDEEIKRTLEVLLDAGLISPYYEGEWGFRAFCVYNSDGSTRMVNDYSWLNARTEGDAYPCQSVPDMLNRFGGAILFSCFDINKAFFNIRVAEDSKKYTAFTTKYGTFVWNVMPFGGKAAPSTWARASDIIFKQCVDLIKYVDDFIIATKPSSDSDGTDYSKEDYRIDIKTQEKHLESIQQFFECCSKYNIKIKLSKCEFFVKEVKFLGNIINATGRRPDDKYVKNLLQYQRPMDKQELRAYLGALNWIAKHVYKFKRLLVPLQKLTHKSTAFKWDKEHQEAFEKIQQYIQTTEILHHPNWKEPFYVFVDASKYYYGGVLLQKRYGKYVVIDMFSRSWRESQIGRHITTKELLALVECVREWRPYLYTNEFTIHSDSRNLLYLFDKINGKRSNNKYHERWVLLLSQYDFKVQHIAGIHNCVADYLSRYIKGTVNVPQYRRGDKPMSEYNKHKRFKFNDWKKQKVYINQLINGIDEEHQREFLPSTQGKHRLYALGALRNSEYWNRDYKFDTLYTNWNLHQYVIQEEQLKGYSFLHNLEKGVKICWENRRKIDRKYPIRSNLNIKSIKNKTLDHMLVLLRRSKRLADKKDVDYVSEKHFENPTTVIPEEEIDSSDLEEQSERSQSIDKTQRNILEEVDKGNLTGIIDEETSDTEEENDEEIGGIWPRANEPYLRNANYNIDDTIYSKDLVKDPAIETLDMFTMDSIRTNQGLWPEYRIISNYLKGIDTRNELDDLGGRTKNNVLKGLYKIHDEVLFYEDNGLKRICLPPEHRRAALEYLHTNLLYGLHGSYKALVEEIKKRFYWSGYDEEIKEYVGNCVTCQRSKRYPNKKQGLAKLFNAKYPNHMVAIDHTGPLPTTAEGYRYITTYYDRYSGYTRSVPCKSIGAFETSMNFINEWVTLFGAPKIVLTDNGTDFRSKLFTYLSEKIMGIQLRSTSAYHASCNGAVERFNRTLKTGLRSISCDKQLDFSKGDSWDLYVKYMNSVHNNRKSRRFNYKYSPNEVFMGRSILLPLDYKLHDNIRLRSDYEKRAKAEGFITNMYKMINSAAPKELEAYHKARKKAMDKGRNRPKYKLNDLVMYWIGPYPWFGSEKVRTHWQGPYRIIQIWNKRCNYTLQSVNYPKVFVNANVKRLSSFRKYIDKRRQVNADHVPEADLRNIRLQSREFREEIVPEEKADDLETNQLDEEASDSEQKDDEKEEWNEEQSVIEEEQH